MSSTNFTLPRISFTRDHFKRNPWKKCLPAHQKYQVNTYDQLKYDKRDYNLNLAFPSHTIGLKITQKKSKHERNDTDQITFRTLCTYNK